MNENEKAISLPRVTPHHMDADTIDFELLEKQLEQDLMGQQSELAALEEDFKKIGTPEALGETVTNVVWEQFINQVGVIAGEDFIKENRGLNLDLSDSAHIQTTENFAKGKIAKNNAFIDYQERYDSWQASFERNPDGSIKTHTTRSGKEVPILKSEARAPFDKDRPTGSRENGTDMDHVIAAAEIIRDPAANAHLSLEEQVAFANSETNLHEMNASHNRSKKDTPMPEWLNNPNSKGKKPEEIFADLSPELKEKYLEEYKKAQEEYERVKKEGEARSIAAGRKSQRDEAFRIGGKALRAVLMGLLASLIKEVMRKLVQWIRAGRKNFSNFMNSLKEALGSFLSKIKQHLITAGDTLVTTVATAIYGHIVDTLKKAWVFLKQGYQSVKQAISFLKDPGNKNMPIGLKMMEVGKIVIAGFTAGGAIVLGEVLEKALMSFGPFAVPIPFLGSVASILGMFLGALVSGLLGALALNIIDRIMAPKLKQLNMDAQIAKGNEMLSTSRDLLVASYGNVQQKTMGTLLDIGQRHQEAAGEISRSLDNVSDNLDRLDESMRKSTQTLRDIDELLKRM